MAPQTFPWKTRELAYLDDPYNHTRQNERAVEVPIAMAWRPPRTRIAGQVPRGLELGNVLGHYYHTDHHVVDLYEGPDHTDVFDIEGSYDWVLSISTLEHVRWDPPEPRDPAGALNALAHLYGLVRPGGHMLVTVPLGCHPHLDTAIRVGAALDPFCVLGSSYDCIYTRDGEGGWERRSTDDPTAWKPYGLTTIWAESIWVAEWVKL